ncbi:DeoR/GlpR family DNA-binding transcription regulator [Streptomyces sp. NPDC087856]|uniref:DeoR/GlpR family DNA-binding transcription regulator n=1 Tax=Streptomyces sp. NPDC087856 TaxID=3365811 RepID=UPI00382065B8
MTSSGEVLPGEVRRERILDLLLQEQEFIRIVALAEAFGVSVVTIRSDLDVLESQGLIRRLRGGARALSLGSPIESSFEQALGSAALEKVAIARAAAQLVTSGQSIVLDAGTTVTFLARELVARKDLTDLVVFTNSTRAAYELEPTYPRVSVVLTGGTLRPLQHCLIDPMGGRILDQIHADTAFLGCSGVDATAGVTHVNMPEAEMKVRMIRATTTHVLLADSSKLGQIQLAPVSPLTDIDLLITGDGADPGTVGLLREIGLSVELAKV